MHRSLSLLLCLLSLALGARLAVADDTKPSTLVQTVKPGESHNNGDVTVKNEEGESKGDAYVDPRNGTAKSASEVTTQARFVGEVSGLDANDSVSIGSSNTATVSGTGGTVSVAGGSTVTVTNVGGQGSSNLEVKLASGSTVIVPPGAAGVVIKT